MIILLSPSKTMDADPAAPGEFTQPVHLKQSEELVQRMRGFSTEQLMDFMDISEKLAELNRRRFSEWQPPFTPENAKQALRSFSGDVYDGLDAASLSRQDIRYAQKHLRILSGLYGLLRPLDLIQPYRLEMGRPLETRVSKNLYGFWRETITDALNAEKGDVLVNLASQEYFKAVDTKALHKKVISPVFKDEKNGTYKVVSFYAKKARGAMARFLVKNQVADLEGMQEFSADGYTYDPELSKENSPVYRRPEKRG